MALWCCAVLCSVVSCVVGVGPTDGGTVKRKHERTRETDRVSPPAPAQSTNNVTPQHKHKHRHAHACANALIHVHTYFYVGKFVYLYIKMCASTRICMHTCVHRDVITTRTINVACSHIIVAYFGCGSTPRRKDR